MFLCPETMALLNEKSQWHGDSFCLQFNHYNQINEIQHNKFTGNAKSNLDIFSVFFSFTVCVHKLCLVEGEAGLLVECNHRRVRIVNDIGTFHAPDQIDKGLGLLSVLVAKFSCNYILVIGPAINQGFKKLHNFSCPVLFDLFMDLFGGAAITAPGMISYY